MRGYLYSPENTPSRVNRVGEEEEEEGAVERGACHVTRAPKNTALSLRVVPQTSSFVNWTRLKHVYRVRPETGSVSGIGHVTTWR